MDDNRLNQLMDEGWKKLNVTLETELPVKKDRKFVYVWLVLYYKQFVPTELVNKND